MMKTYCSIESHVYRYVAQIRDDLSEKGRLTATCDFVRCGVYINFISSGQRLLFKMDVKTKGTRMSCHMLPKVEIEGSLERCKSLNPRSHLITRLIYSNITNYQTT